MSLRGEGLSFGYHACVPLFSGADLEVTAGEIVGLHGYSGSGKTTLGKVLGGYYRPWSGTVSVGGEPLSYEGFCPVQVIHQHPELSVDPRWRVRRTLAQVRAPIDELLEHFELDPAWLDRRPIELSGGELQRFCIARAFDERTRYLVADEISTMLDGIRQAELWRQIVDLAADRGIGMLVISHDHDLLTRVCQRTLDFAQFTDEPSTPCLRTPSGGESESESDK